MNLNTLKSGITNLETNNTVGNLSVQLEEMTIGTPIAYVSNFDGK